MKKHLLKTFQSLSLAFLLSVMTVIAPAAAQEDLAPSLPEREINEETLASFEGWDEVEIYWQELKKEMEEYLPVWDIKDIFKNDEGGIITRIREIFKGFAKFLFREITANFGLLGQLIFLAVAAALLKSLQGAFGSEEVARLSEAIAFFVMLGLALKSFSLALNIGRDAVYSMTNFMLALLPFLLTLLASMGHVASTSLFHPFIIFAVNFMASLIRNVFFPFIFFACILYLVNHFSPHFQIKRLADLFKDISIWGLGLMLTVFVGLTAVQGVAGGIGDALTLRTAKYVTGSFIPVVGKMLAEAVETVLGYSLLIKNSATITGLVILSFIVAFPLLKLLSLVIIYKVSGALIQPLGETTLGEALHTMSNCLIAIFAAVATMALAFFIGIAIILGASNAVVMLR